ncbi:MAG TPA: hypothetical protein VGD84_00350 [Pseudonocardiaceae bacterium]
MAATDLAQAVLLAHAQGRPARPVGRRSTGGRGDLVAQDEQFDVLGCPGTTEQHQPT